MAGFFTHLFKSVFESKLKRCRVNDKTFGSFKLGQNRGDHLPSDTDHDTETYSAGWENAASNTNVSPHEAMAIVQTKSTQE